ncbi:MAG: glycosyltransferase family 2 protein [Bacteroidales bacterium]|nr:glycosyltransferase family 2 protein [Bacteroidales bacterium]MCF8405613.1 glycosyltransferase family 2 protein [Bacteroidales bacterium]
MITLWLILHLIEILIFGYLAFSALYIFIFSFAGLFYTEQTLRDKAYRKIAVLIPGFREDAVIVDVANQALAQVYPKDMFDVVIIADSFRQDTIEKLKELPIRLIEVSFEKSTKSKALNKALEILPEAYDICVILDADNIMQDDFLKKINNQFSDTVRIIQSHRVAKNSNTKFAILDAVSEEINNHIFRKGHRVMGLSSALIGSGMAFDYVLFKSYMADIKAIGGFDKELELTLLNDRIKIHYNNNALVYDEKIQKSADFTGQRRRWLSAQFIYFGQFFKQSLIQLFKKGNLDMFDKLLQMALLPRILLIGLSLIINMFIALVAIIIQPETWAIWIHPEPWLWMLLLGTIILSLLFSIPARLYNQNTFKAIMSLPKGFLLMFRSLVKIKGANKKFIHTQHGQT